VAAASCAAATAELAGQELVGTTLQKHFGRKLFTGEVESFDDELYHVVYEDGDAEDLEQEEVDTLQAAARARSAKALQVRGVECARACTGTAPPPAEPPLPGAGRPCSPASRIAQSRMIAMAIAVVEYCVH
jgi:hypothetical protein